MTETSPVQSNKYLSILCLMLDLVFYTYGSDFSSKSHVCYRAVKSHSTYTNKTLIISQDERDYKKIVEKSRLRCVYETYLSTGPNGGLQITFMSNNISNFAKCRTFSSIYFKVGRVGKPVKTLSCSDSGTWTIPWPSERVVVEINLSSPSTEKHLNESSTAILSFKNVLMSSNIGYKEYKKQIILGSGIPSPGTPRYCLGDFFYKVTFRRKYYSSGYTIRKIMFRLINKSVCIQPYTNFRYYNRCPWNIHVRIGGALLMVLDCKYLRKYWCLPESWIKNSSEWLVLHYLSTDLYNSYTVLISSNETKSTYRSYTCPFTTTTTPTTTTTDWYSNFDSGVDYKSRKHTSSTAIYIPIIGVLVFVFAVFCGASYMRSQRRHREYGGRLSHRLEMPFRSSDSEELPQNPAYRTRDPVRGPLFTPNGTNDHNSYNDQPPSYEGVMATILPDGREQLSPTNTLPAASIPTAPPPSYEEALTMIDSKNSSNT